MMKPKHLFGLAALTAGALAVRQGLKAYNRRALHGNLELGPAVLQPGQYVLGQFTLHWQPAGGGQLSVTHAQTGARVLWSSVAGAGFVAVARGVEKVTESHGSFLIADALQSVCAAQRLEAINLHEERLRLTGDLTGSVGKVPYTLEFWAELPNQLGFCVSVEREDINRVYLKYDSSADEHFFGFGEQFSYFDLKGKRLPIFVQEQGLGRGIQPMTFIVNLLAKAGGDWSTTYAGVPHYVTSQLRSLFLENSEYSVFDLRAADKVQVSVFANRMCGRILAGNSPAELVSEYTLYCGRMRRLPDWILEGAVVGMQGGTEKVRSVLAELDARQIPLAAFWLQDWVGQRVTGFGKQLWWNWEMDHERYPGWADLRAELAGKNIRLMTYINPFLVDVSGRAQVRRNLFSEARERGYLVLREDGTPYLVENTDFLFGLVDFSNPEAWAWYQQVLQELVLGEGVSGWMADFGEAMPYDARLASGEPASRAHNLYPVAWAQLNRAVVDASPQGDELVFFMRSGYSRSPGYSTLFWAGDQTVTWDANDGIKTAVIAMLSSGLSGFSLNHSDIGGYTAIKRPPFFYLRSKELLLRWMDLCAMTTIFRTHEGNLPDDNAQIYSDAESLDHFARMARVYQAWGFYRKQLVRTAAESGLPVIRPLWMHFPDDPHTVTINYQEFLLGEELLVVPALDPGVTTVSAYLPSGEWVHMWSGTTYPAGNHRVAAPLGQPAVFYRVGSAVGDQFVRNLRDAGVLESD